MADATWIIDRNDKIYSIIKGKTNKTIKALYPNVFYTNENANNSSATFPTIYIHSLGTIEQEETLEGDEIESATFSFEVSVKSNESAEVAKEVMGYILKAFKSLRFNLITANDVHQADTVYTLVYRFRREIASNDIL